MHQKSIGGRWQAYLKEKMAAALNRRSAWFLFGLAFISVYREVFESILFYAALWNDGQEVWLLGGIAAGAAALGLIARSEEHTSELQSLMRNSYAVFCLKKKKPRPYRYTP